MIERSNFTTPGTERPIPASCPPEFRRRITEEREKRSAAKDAPPVEKPVDESDPEMREILRKAAKLSVGE